jgi:hypothetical protein
MSKDQDFLLYPLDTGEDPVCLGCGALMTLAGHAARETKPGFHHLPMPELWKV